MNDESGLAAAGFWRPSDRSPKSAALRNHAPIVALLVAAALYLPVAIDWGLPHDASWDDDEVVTTSVAAWPRRYPPLQRDLLDGLAAASRLIAPETFDVPSARRYDLRLEARAVCVLFTLGTLLVLFRLSRRLCGESGAWLPPLLYLAALEVPFLAKIARLEAPYVFWFSLALLFWVRAREAGRRRDVLAFATFGALSFLTKDQALALYVVPAPALLAEMAWRASRATAASGGRSWWLRWTGTASLAAFLVVGATVAAYRLPWGWNRFVSHVHSILHGASEPYRMVEKTVAGQWELLERAAIHIRFLMTGPGLAIVVAGIVTATIDRTLRRRLLPLLLFPLSYYVLFIGLAGYHRVRFFLPIALVGVLFTPAIGRALAARARPVFVHAVLALLVVSAALPPHIEFHERMLGDTRYDAEGFLSSPAMADSRRVLLGNDHSSVRLEPRLSRYGFLARRGCSSLRETDWVVASPLHASFRGDNRSGYEAVRSGRLGFDLFATFARPRSDVIEFRGALSELLRPSPTVEVYRRRTELCASNLEDWYAQAIVSGREDEVARFARLVASDAWTGAPLRDPDRGLYAVVGLSPDGWTRGTEPAVVVAKAGDPRASRIRVAHEAPRAFFPLELVLRSSAGDRGSWTLQGPGALEIDLPLSGAPPGPVVWEISAQREWIVEPPPGSRAEPRRLGFRVDPAPGPSRPDGA